MRTYLLSLGMGLIVGFVYGLVDVRSPAPPIVALLGLLGMVAGEGLARQIVGRPAPVAVRERAP